ncbi:hypothetical protein F4818DRAFT_320909 [Hypoxylon cercidicola]|nr:hypothetical protein F4818DRAFT_320909 [Hypoxylon cercidicola]
MTSNLGRALRGSCHCGRNQYIVQIPSNTTTVPQIIFDSAADHRISSATPLSAFLRVPLSWYQSQIFPFFPDESRVSIRRVYSHPTEQNAMRQFCGFCGTPLSYWSEEPRSEADYIQVTLGSLLTEDLHDLEESGLLPEQPAPEIMDIIPTPTPTDGSQLVGRDITSIPWFENMILGSRLGNVHTTRGVRESRDRRIRVEYEITEWTGDDATDGETGEKPESSASATASASATGKRKRGEADDGGTTS